MTTASLSTGLNEVELLKALTALKNGDFTVRMAVSGAGTAGQIAETVNTLQDQLLAYASETNRITHEIGVEGLFGGQAEVPALSGSWKEMLDGLNTMAYTLTDQVRDFAGTTHAIASGDLTRKVSVKAKGEMLEWKTTVNIMVEQLNFYAAELTRVVRALGTDGKLGAQMDVPGVLGIWRDLLTNVNTMAFDLTRQIRSLHSVTLAVANGDLSMRITTEARGETEELKNLINTMIERLNVLFYEFSRLARELGTEGKLGGQAEVAGMAGDWKDLIDQVNRMSANLTHQIRDLSHTIRALAEGDTSHKVTAPAAGEVVHFKDAVNSLVDKQSRARQ